MHRSGAALAAILAALSLASSASGDSYCVAPASGCDHSSDQLRYALTDAANHPGDDTIRLGAADYEDIFYDYDPPDHARVAIVGAGSKQTTIGLTTGATGQSTLAGAGPIDLSGATVLIGPASGQAQTDNVGLVLPYGGSLNDVELRARDKAIDPSGVTAGDATTITGSAIALPGGGTCVEASGPGTVRVLDSELRGCATGISTSATRLLAQRLRIEGVLAGMTIDAGIVNLDDSVLELAPTGTVGAAVTADGNGRALLLALQDTILGPGGATAISVYNHADPEEATAWVYDTIMRGFWTTFSQDSDSSDHPSSVEAQFNDYDGKTTQNLPLGMQTFAVYTDDPLFVDPGRGDFRLRSDSPLLDLDTRPFSTFYEEPESDLGGNLRIINGKRDLGAFERPLAPTAATGPAASVGDTSAVLPVTASGGGGKASVTLRWGPTTSYGYEIRLEDISPQLTPRGYAVPLTGLAPGTTYHFALVVTNQSGTASSPDRAFATTTPAPPPACCDAPPPPVAKAALSRLRLLPSRFRAAARGPMLAGAGTGARVTFKLSAAGTVTFRVLRATSGVTVGARCVARSRRHRRAGACTRYVAVGKPVQRAAPVGTNSLRFSGRVGGRKLRPGSYRLQSLDPAGTTRSVRFTILR